MSMRAKRRLTNEINVVPYIDVMLVLLIIFMITAPLLTTGVEVDLPDAQAAVMDFGEENQPIILTVKQSGDLYLNVGENPDQPLTPAQVTRITSTVLNERPNAPVLVKGAGKGDYGNVVRGMVMLENAGAEQVGLLTDDLAGPSPDEGEAEALDS